jgi:thiosulfate/3-mercaptopyruvate sulfurtransferase
MDKLRIGIIVLVLLVLSLSVSVLQTSVHVSAQTAAYVNPQLLVDAKWVADNKDKSGIVLVDVRSSGDYGKGHIPGAINFQANKLLRGVDSRIIPVSTMIKILGDAGINNLNTVVWYGVKADSSVTVGFWILEYLGQPNASVFWGGIDDWKAAGYPTTTNPTALPATTYQASVIDGRYASTDWVQPHKRFKCSHS